MKSVGVLIAALITQSSFALECSHDRTDSGGGASMIAITENADGTYLIDLSQSKSRASETDSVAYDGATCDISKSNPLLLTCTASEEVGQLQIPIMIETQLTHTREMGDTLSIVVDTAGAIEKATGGALGPAVKNILVPVSSCN